MSTNPNPQPIERSLFEQTEPDLAASLQSVAEAVGLGSKKAKKRKPPEETPEAVRHAAAVLGAHAHGRPLPVAMEVYVPITTPAQARAVGEKVLASIDAARAKMEDGMARAEAHADDAWKEEALQTVRRMAQTRESFTADDVHGELSAEVSTHDLRALGPILNKAARLEWIKADGYVPSRRRNCSPVRVWRSTVVGVPDDFFLIPLERPKA